MSLDGSANYFPLTINGLQEISADSSSVTTLQVNSLTPNRVVVSDGSNYLVSAGASTTEVDYLIGTSSNVQSQLNARATTSYVDTNFLNKTTSSDQTVAGKVTYTKELVVSDEKVANLASKVVVDANYQNLITSANVSVSQNFGTITNALGVYQSTTNTSAGTPILIFFPITNTKRYRFTVEVLVEDTGATWYVAPFQSVDNVNPVTYGLLPFTVISANTSVYTLVDLSFEAVTTGNVVVSVESDLGAGNDKAFKWKNLTVYEEGVALTNVSMPAQLADRVVVLNDKKQLVSSGISTTKLGYLDNVSSDIQTQLNNRLTLSGSNANQNIVIGAYKVQSSATPSTGNDYTNKTYVDGAISGLSSVYVLKSGDTMTGALTVNAAVNVGNRFLGTPDSSPSGNFWMGLRGTGTEVDRLAISIAGNSTTGVVSGVYIPKVLYLQSASATTAFQVFSTQSNHYDGTASDTYLMSGIDGYLTIAKKTTQNDTEACLMLGTDNDMSELASVTTDGSDIMPIKIRGTVANIQGQYIDYDSRLNNPSLAQLVISNYQNGERLLLGNYYTAGVGSGCFIQSSDYYTSADHGTELLLNPLGGYVGVGTNSPSYPLEVIGNVRSTTGFLLNNLGDCRFYNGTADSYSPTTKANNLIIKSWWGIGYESYDGGVRIAMDTRTGDAYYAGKIGIGTDTPEARLHVSASGGGNPSTNGIYVYNTNNTASQDAIVTVRVAGSSAGDAFTSYDIAAEYGWASGIRNTDNAYVINQGWDNVRNAEKFVIYPGGNVYIPGNVGFGGTADMNGKINIRNPNGSYSHIGYSNNSNYFRGDWTIIDSGLQVNGTNFYRGQNPTTTNNTYNNTTTRLMFREGDGYVRHGDCSTWTYRNNSVAWTGGLILNNSLYRVSASSTIIFTIQGSWWATSGGNKDFIIELWSGPVQPFVGTLKVYTSVRKYFNITVNHETITIPITYTSSELGATTGWYSFYFYAGGGGITSDSNDTIWWSAQIIG
jgi:stress response protein SCP2